MAKTHKTIFGTTEKSNFILNMTSDQFSKTASVLFIIGFAAVFISSAAAEILSNQILNEANYDWKIIPSVGLAIAGILSVSIFIIAFIKQTLTKKQIAAALIGLALAVFMYISYINGISTIVDYSPFLGYRYGRYEGLMVPLSYLFIFLGSISLNREKTVNTVFRFFSLIMLLESIWAALQFIPSFPGHYYRIPYIVNPVMLPSGTAGSPAFLAVLMAAGLTVSVFGAMHDKAPGFSAVYTAAVLPASFFLVKTQTLTGYISSAVILAAVLSDCFRNRKNGKKGSLPITLMITGFAAAYGFILIKGFAVYDGEIIWHDGCGRLGAFGQYSANVEGTFNIHSIGDIYPFLWNKAEEIIRHFPVTGIGPDAFLFSQTSGPLNDVPLSVDRPYSEYLFYAASFGIPAAVSLAALFFYSAANGVISAAGNKSWVFKASMTVAVLYTAAAVITNSTATVTPFIWFIFGTCCCTFKED
ncbi:MAG: O-antigen ligase family protein [Oscillospiraceae bacterium]|nr:O-antigen ligase family protein [Oscillospiraceae bacterium]